MSWAPYWLGVIIFFFYAIEWLGDNDKGKFDSISTTQIVVGLMALSIVFPFTLIAWAAFIRPAFKCLMEDRKDE